MSKQDARDWQAQQKNDKRLAEYKEEQIELLYYAAFKHTSGYPCVGTLREVGLDAAADKLDAAYRLIEEAHKLATSNVLAQGRPEAEGRREPDGVAGRASPGAAG
jgi:hypothetical protein